MKNQTCWVVMTGPQWYPEHVFLDEELAKEHSSLLRSQGETTLVLEVDFTSQG